MVAGINSAIQKTECGSEDSFCGPWYYISSDRPRFMDANETAWMNNNDIPGISVRDCIPGDFAAVISLWSVSGIRISPSDSEEEIELNRQRDPDLFLVA